MNKLLIDGIEISSGELELVRDHRMGLRGIFWGTNDFVHAAQELKGKRWEEVYDVELFPIGLENMLAGHDCNEGITWYTVRKYLYDCVRPGIIADSFPSYPVKSDEEE